MKLKIVRQIITIMSKALLYGIFTQCLFLGILLAEDSKGQEFENKSIEEIDINLNKERSALKKVFGKVEKQTGFTFSYHNSILSQQVIETEKKKVILGDFLRDISKKYQLSFKRVNETIAVAYQKNQFSETTVVEELNYQQFLITGQITSSEDNEALPGVSVLIKGTATGTTTDISGNYSLRVTEGDVLQYSYIGYKTQEISVVNQSIINITLQVDLAQLEEVVVIGYGQRDKKDLTGAISNMTAKDIEKTIGMQPELAMQGRMTGVFVSTPGGAPNDRPQVRIRGVGTFGFAEPLYVIDGVPITEFGSNAGPMTRERDLRGTVNVLNLINPNDIESISVLKDASAAAIYGVRAANGVILITTKKGSKGKPKLEINASYGVQNIPNTYDMLNVDQYVNLYQEAYANFNATRDTDQQDPLLPEFDPNNPGFLGNLPTIDWQTPLLNENAVTSDYSAKISGGSESTTYYVSGGYTYIESPLVNNNQERYSFATNVNSKVSDFFEVGATFRLGYIDALENTSDDLSYVSRTSPWQPIYDPNGPYGFAPSAEATFIENPDLQNEVTRGLFQPAIPAFVFDTGPDLLWGAETNNNGFARNAITDRRYRMLRNIGTAYAQINPLKGLSIRATFSGDWYYNRRISWQNYDLWQFRQTPGNPFSGHDGSAVGSYGERNLRNTNIVGEITVQYNKNFGDHRVNVTLNAMDQRYLFEGAELSGPVLLDGERFRQVTEQIPGIFRSGQNYFNEDALQGYMARASYSFAGKYYLDATVRRDGSSRFAPDFRWGTFPSFSAAWRISSESFMDDVNFINDLKIRGGWGQLGNQETRSFAFLSTVSLNPQLGFGSGDGDANGVVDQGAMLPDFPVPDLTWEVATTTNIGFDAILFNNKVTLTAEYYSRLTSDILQAANLPASVGNINQPVLNIASVRNRGVELALGYNNSIGDFNYGVSANLTTVDNEVVELFREQPFGGQQDRIEEGFPLFFLWGYEVGGIFQNQSEIDEWTGRQSDLTNGDNFQPGDIYFNDVRRAPNNDENPLATYEVGQDSLINPLDRTFIGNTIPKYFYGVTLNASYKNFDLSVLFQGIGGVQAVNEVRRSGEGMGGTGSNQWATVLNRWTPENPSTTMPRAVRQDPAGNNRFSDRWVEDAGFMRLKNFQLGYSIPEALIRKLKMSRLRLYVAGTNVLTFTNWTGIDPEESGGRSVVPPPRVFTLGVNAAF